MTYQTELGSITADVAKAQNTDFLASDFQVKGEGRLVRICIAVDANVEVDLVPSSGSQFELNGGSALTANAVYLFEVLLDIGRTWNLQTPNVAGCNVLHLVIQEVGP